MPWRRVGLERCMRQIGAWPQHSFANLAPRSLSDFCIQLNAQGHCRDGDPCDQAIHLLSSGNVAEDQMPMLSQPLYIPVSIALLWSSGHMLWLTDTYGLERCTEIEQSS